MTKDVTHLASHSLTVHSNPPPMYIGIIHRLHTWSRGIVEIVSGGGIIEYWAPIFESEGPVQTFFIMLMFLLLKLKGLDEDDYRKFYISYDDMPSIGVTTSSPK